MRMLVSFLLLVSLANAAYYAGLERGDYVSYDILQFNDAANMTWIHSSDFLAWHASAGGSLRYEILGLGGNSGQYDPRTEQYWADVRIGDLSLMNISDYEVADNLILSVYPHYFGVVADTDWGGHIAAVSGIPNASVEVSYGSEQYAGIAFDTIRFQISLGGQQTTLVYDIRTGVLLYARTGFGNYWLEMALQETNIFTPPAFDSRVVAIAFIVCGAGALVWLVKKR